MEIVLLIGAAEYPLTTDEATRLDRAIRKTCLDERRLRWTTADKHVCNWRTCSPRISRFGASPERVELGMSHVRGLRGCVFEGEGLSADELAELRAAAERFSR